MRVPSRLAVHVERVADSNVGADIGDHGVRDVDEGVFEVDAVDGDAGAMGDVGADLTCHASTGEDSGLAFRADGTRAALPLGVAEPDGATIVAVTDHDALETKVGDLILEIDFLTDAEVADIELRSNGDEGVGGTPETRGDVLDGNALRFVGSGDVGLVELNRNVHRTNDDFIAMPRRQPGRRGALVAESVLDDLVIGEPKRGEKQNMKLDRSIWKIVLHNEIVIENLCKSGGL